MPVAHKSLKIQHKNGLHARPSMAIVDTVAHFSSTISLQYKKTTVNAKSVLEVLQLGAPNGASIEATADGADAEAALQALDALFKSGFGL